MKKAYFAGGCFWCITPIFKIYKASSVISGYSGGDEVNPSYEDVKAQRTGHRETICVEYDESKTDYETLLEIYLANVDPFDSEGQFIDKGFSYTLAIYYTDESQRIAADNALRALEQESGRKPAIALEPFKSFYPAEEYHQDYYLKNPEAFEKELEESGRKDYFKN
jgi:methionine-S-sulfoxide reductase